MNLSREELGTICFLIFSVVWAYTAIKMFPYPDEVENDRE